MTSGAYTCTRGPGTTSTTSEKCVPGAATRSVTYVVSVRCRRAHLRRRRVDRCTEPAELHQHARDRVALLIRGLEMPRRDDALRVDDERAGERNAVGLVRRRDRRVQDAVLLDDGRTGIRQQRKRDAASRREVRERRHRIVADRDQRRALHASARRDVLAAPRAAFCSTVTSRPSGRRRARRLSARTSTSASASRRAGPGALNSGTRSPTFGPQRPRIGPSAAADSSTPNASAMSGVSCAASAWSAL